MGTWPGQIVAIAALLLMAIPPAGAVHGQATGPCPDGGECDTIALIDPSGRFEIRDSLDAPAAATVWYFGNPGDVPLLGDWDCDGAPTPAMFRPSNGFVYLRNDLVAGPAEEEFFFGNPGDVALAGDFNGDGCDTISVYRPAEARIYVTNRLGNGRADTEYVFGNPGDRPFVADFDGDGVDTLGLHRHSTGFVYFRNSHTSGAADFEFFYGDPGDVIMAGDWNGDGVDTLAVHRPGERRLFVRLSNSAGRADYDYPMPAGVAVLPARSSPAGPGSETGPFDPEWEQTVGAQLDRSAVAVSLYVDTASPAAADTNPATPEAPLATITAALERAQDHRAEGRGVRIVVAPGVYREALEIVGPNLPGPDPLLVLEAAEAGTVIVSGSDVWGGWQPVGDGQWAADWPHDWGRAAIPPGWENVEVADIVRRREMVFVDGAALTQVLNATDLVPGTFLVDEAGDRISVIPADPGSFAAARVEVAVRAEALRILLTDHVLVDGLSFTHANAPLGNAVGVLESDDVRIENSAIDWNNWGGLQIFDADRVTVADSTASHNGGRGIGMADARSVLVEGVETSHNNWRGQAGGFTGWSVAGAKVHHLHDAIFREYVSTGNAARGLWLDTDNIRVVVDRVELCGNLRDGVFVEASQGPIVMHAAVVCENGDHGLLTANATHLSLLDSLVCGNGQAQLELSGLAERTVDLHETGGTMTLPAAADWVAHGNEIAAAGGSVTLVGTTLGAPTIDHFAATLDAGENAWSSIALDAFELRDGTFGGFDEWQSLTGDGPGSSFAQSAVGGGCGP